MEDKYYARCENGEHGTPEYCMNWCSKKTAEFSKEKYKRVICWDHQRQADMKMMMEDAR